MDEAEFEKAADEALTALRQALDEAGLDVEVELSMGILSLEFPDGAKYVINSHRAARQIWMAAERQAWHFDFDRATGRWVAPKSGDELWDTVTRALEKKTGAAPRLARSP